MYTFRAKYIFKTYKKINYFLYKPIDLQNVAVQHLGTRRNNQHVSNILLPQISIIQPLQNNHRT